MATPIGGLKLNAVNIDGDTMSGSLTMAAGTRIIFSGQQSASVAINKTLDNTDCGVLQVVTASATVTLPATKAGLSYIIINGATSGTVTVTVAPNPSDRIFGNELNAEDDRDVVNTLGNYGDCLRLIGDGNDGWYLSDVVGTWTREVVASESVSPSASPSKSPSVSVSPSGSPSVSPSVSVSPSGSPSTSPSASVSPSVSVSPSASASVSPSVSVSPSASASTSPSVSVSPSGSPSVSPSSSVSPSTSASPSKSASVSPSLSPSV